MWGLQMMPRKSDAEHELQGTASAASPENLGAPGSKPRAPKDLDADEKKIFRQIVRELEKRRTVTSGDTELIRLVAIQIVRHKRAMAKVREEGEIKIYMRLNNHGESVPTEKRNLWLDVACEAEGKITAILDRLGFTPLNRARVRPTKEESSDGLKFL